ncbi:hypothetical protein EG68_12063 [Paragonimus skrjabini miyazakii]|uniref:Uncharacterized protein n=1 Tax=Paragonimus skrjabini miyazakii TaxID=59628 RepID=A0A8S9YCH5_9TREM|nr:hypothetical protein EG68_12063 [Paragonimus skrjabini miyazakii]
MIRSIDNSTLPSTYINTESICLLSTELVFYNMFKLIFVLVLCMTVVCPLEATSHGLKSDALSRDPDSFEDWEQRPVLPPRVNLEELRRKRRN